MIVKNLMTSPAITCEIYTSIKEAVQIMKEKNIGFLPITKNGILVGVVTDRDITIRAFGIFKSNTKIEKIMTNQNLYFVNPDTTLKEAAEKIANNKIRRLVVLNDGKVVGVLTSKNLINNPTLFKYICETYTENKTLKEYSMYTNSNPNDSIKASDFIL